MYENRTRGIGLPLVLFCMIPQSVSERGCCGMTAKVNNPFNTGDKNLDRMNRNLFVFAHQDAMTNDPRAMENWLRMSYYLKSGDIFNPAAFIRL